MGGYREPNESEMHNLVLRSAEGIGARPGSGLGGPSAPRAESKVRSRRETSENGSAILSDRRGASHVTTHAPATTSGGRFRDASHGWSGLWSPSDAGGGHVRGDVLGAKTIRTEPFYARKCKRNHNASGIRIWRPLGGGRRPWAEPTIRSLRGASGNGGAMCAAGTHVRGSYVTTHTPATEIGGQTRDSLNGMGTNENCGIYAKLPETEARFTRRACESHVTTHTSPTRIGAQF